MYVIMLCLSQRGGSPFRPFIYRDRSPFLRIFDLLVDNSTSHVPVMLFITQHCKRHGLLDCSSSYESCTQVLSESRYTRDDA